MTPSARYTLAELEALPTIRQGHFDNLKIETFGDPPTRVWLARTGVEDGEPYDNRVTVETLQDGCWIEAKSYPAATGAVDPEYNDAHTRLPFPGSKRDRARRR